MCAGRVQACIPAIWHGERVQEAIKKTAGKWISGRAYPTLWEIGLDVELPTSSAKQAKQSGAKHD